MDSKYIRRFLFLSITGLLIAALWNSPSAHAMASMSPHTVGALAPDCNMTVTNTNDSGTGSLRNAIENTSCPGSTNVVFNSSLSGQTIILTSGQITINDTTTIDASSLAEPITISGNNSSRHFFITNGTIMISHIIFIDGRANEDNGGSILIENAPVDVTIQNSQFIGNEATYEGGAIRNEGTTTTISQSSFIDNIGGSFGGGVSNNAGTVTITNSTFYHNQSSSGGALHNNETMYLQNNTLVDNGAISTGSAINNHTSSTLHMSNNLIVGTLSPPYDAPDCQNIGTLATNTNNWIEDNSCSPAFSGNPLLSPLTDNGGRTPTAMPRLDSPAVNAGNCSSGPATDQRGQPRPQNNTCDIGAVEVQQPLDTDVTQCGLVQGNTYLFRATGVQLTIDTLGGLNCISTEIFNAVHPNATASITAPYVTINATTVSAAPYAVTMTLLHDNLSNPFICKYPGAGGWDCARAGYDNRTIWRSGINSFSDWAIGINANAPVANTNNYTTAENTLLTISSPGVLNNDTDADGNSLTAVLDTNVGDGSLSLNSNGSFSYTPDTNFCGQDSFTYHARDGYWDSNITTVTIDVTCSNAAPVANANSYTTAEDTPLTVTAPGILGNDTDGDGDSLTAVPNTDVSNGSLTLNSNGSFSYTPDANFCGTDSFTYHANDGTVNSNLATVTITVSCVNDAPVANANSYTTAEDTPLTITAPGILGNDTDTDGDSLTAVPNTDVSNGSLILNSDGSFSYTPDSNFCGTDSFTYRANDGTVNSNIATVVIINVTCSNEAPIATADQYTMTQGTTLTVPAPGILGNDTDADGDSLTAVLDRNVSSGNLILNSDGSFSYTPPSDICGNSSFEYHANDGTANSNVVWVIITIPCVPFAIADSYTIAEDTPLSITAPGILGNDLDFEGDSFTAVLDTDVNDGSLTLNSDGSFSYTPDTNFCGTDSFTYHAKDDTGDSNIVAVTINVTCHNDAPVANNNSYTTAEDTLLSITAPGILSNDTDADGDSLTAVLNGDVSNGSLSLNSDGSFSYTPDTNFCGTDSFTYHANDGTINSNITTVTIAVTCANDAPVANADNYSTLEDTP